MKLETISEERLVVLFSAYELEAHRKRVTVAEVMQHCHMPFGSEVLGKRFDMTADELQLVEGLLETRYVN